MARVLGHCELILILIFGSFMASNGQDNPSDQLLSSFEFLGNASCQIVINGTSLCSGVLLNSTNESRVNYVMSAAHCLPDTSNIETISMTFGGKPPIDSETFEGHRWTTSFDIRIVALNYQSDYVLYELTEVLPEEISPYFLGWNATAVNPAYGVAYHYNEVNSLRAVLKRTSIKKSSFSYPADYMPSLETIPNGFWRVPNWTVGKTSVGSSGAGLIDQNGNYLGGLTGSTLSTKGNMVDYFARFDLAYSGNQNGEKLRNFLDPQEAGLVSGEHFYEHYKTDLYHSSLDLVRIEDLSSSNSIQVSIDLIDPTEIKGLYLVFGQINTALGSSLGIEIQQENVVLFSSSYSWNSLNENAENFLDFNQKLNISGSLELVISSTSDALLETIELPMIANSSPRLQSRNGESSELIGVPIISFLSNVEIQSDLQKFDFTVFPNPTPDFLFVSPLSGIQDVIVFDHSGKRSAPPYSERFGELIIDVSNMLKGVYILKIRTSQGPTFTSRFFKN